MPLMRLLNPIVLISTYSFDYVTENRRDSKKREEMDVRKELTSGDQSEGGTGVDNTCGLGQYSSRSSITNLLVNAPERV